MARLFALLVLVSGCSSAVAPTDSDCTLNHSAVQECHVTGLQLRASDVLAVDTSKAIEL